MQDFENRLLKNYRHLAKWARRQRISCFRTFDFDLPSYPLCVEKYDGFVHISEYKVKKETVSEEHEMWLKNSVEAVSKVLEISQSNIFVKTRERQSGFNQYEKLSQKSIGAWVEEFGAKLWVNFTDYLDTGLFLDHRETRKWVRGAATSKKVLNLFSYTGSFSVQAALGGASNVDTMDMSNAYLEWAQKNMAANGFTDSNRFRYLREDIMEWLKQPPEELYDIVILDPPTFSNSKKMKRILDIQEDHIFLIKNSLKRLNSGGILYFSNNLRNFKMDYESLKGFTVKDVTAASIPNDFRNKKIHQCFRIEK